MALPPMTVAISSYQRRGPLLRLLAGLDEQLAGSEELRHDLDVVVVLDGSTDGSREAVEAGRWHVPVRVWWQPNRGLAAARNVGLEAAGDRLIWSLDDDLLPAPGLVERHRRAHLHGERAIVVGPCRIPPEVGAPPALLAWWDAFYGELERTGVIERFDRFTTANASGPTACFTEVGGYDERFVGYGLEDYELAVRLLRAGTPLRFDPAAVAWHPDIPPMPVLVQRQRSLGRNAAMLAGIHPELVDELFPLEGPARRRQVLRALRVRRPAALLAVSRAALAVQRIAGPVSATAARRGETLGRAAAYAAGVAEGDRSGDLLDRLLGQPRPWAPRWRPSRRASRQPATNPPSNGRCISR